MMSASTTGRCHKRRLRGLQAGLRPLTSRFDMPAIKVARLIWHSAITCTCLHPRAFLPAPVGNRGTGAKARTGVTQAQVRLRKCRQFGAYTKRFGIGPFSG